MTNSLSFAIVYRELDSKAGRYGIRSLIRSSRCEELDRQSGQRFRGLGQTSGSVVQTYKPDGAS